MIKIKDNNFEQVLSHHGILGQKWGKRNGPPYPIDKDIKKNDKREKKKRYKELAKTNKELKRKIKERKYLTDEELDKMIIRLQKEKNLKDLYLSNNASAKAANDGKKAASEALRDVGKSTFKKVAATVMTGAALYFVGSAVSRVNPNLGKSVATGKPSLGGD